MDGRMRNGNTMALSKTERAEVVEILKELAPRRPLPRDARRSRRRETLQWLWIKTVASTGNRGRAELFRIMLENGSGGGIGFTSRKEMEAGEQFVVPLAFREGGGKLVLCRVKHVRAVDGREWYVGAEFLTTVDDPDGRTKIPHAWMEG